MVKYRLSLGHCHPCTPPIHPAVSFLCAFLEAILSSWNTRIHAENATHAPSSWGQPPDLPGKKKASSQEGADQSLLRPSPSFAHRLLCVDYHHLGPRQVGEDRRSSERGSFVWCCDSGAQSLAWWSSQLLPDWKPSSEPATPILAFWSCWKDLMRAVEPKLCNGFCMHFAKCSPSPLWLFSHGCQLPLVPAGKGLNCREQAVQAGPGLQDVCAATLRAVRPTAYSTPAVLTEAAAAQPSFFILFF